jgi:hypothetical protein
MGDSVDHLIHAFEFHADLGHRNVYVSITEQIIVVLEGWSNTDLDGQPDREAGGDGGVRAISVIR